MLMNCENKNRKNFWERTLEIEDVPPSLFQDLCGSPPCVRFTARRTFDAPCISTNSKMDRGGDCLRGFLLRQWQKAKPTVIAGPPFLEQNFAKMLYSL